MVDERLFGGDVQSDNIIYHIFHVAVGFKALWRLRALLRLSSSYEIVRDSFHSKRSSDSVM